MQCFYLQGRKEGGREEGRERGRERGREGRREGGWEGERLSITQGSLTMLSSRLGVG